MTLIEEKNSMSTTDLLHNTTDATVWAREFVRTISEHSTADPTDEGFMLGWFANAIMVGHDWGYQRGRDSTQPE